MENKDKPVYPIQDNGYPSFEKVIEDGCLVGLTKREHFAGLAMQALISNPDIKRPRDNDEWKNDLKTFSSIAVEYADALLTALETPQQDGK